MISQYSECLSKESKENLLNGDICESSVEPEKRIQLKERYSECLPKEGKKNLLEGDILGSCVKNSEERIRPEESLTLFISNKVYIQRAFGFDDYVEYNATDHCWNIDGINKYILFYKTCW